jgi:hypothetical protein
MTPPTRRGHNSGEQETIWAVADALRAWIERYGVPLALYVDGKNLYKQPANAGERLRGQEPVTQFGRMCAKLRITLIAANSPQAKGRVERQHGTQQDRWVKKLRRKEIHSHEGANVYLEREYLPEHNQRFARTAPRPEDYHRRAPRNWSGYLDSRVNAPSVTIGWCSTTIAFSNWNRRAATMRRREAKCGYARDGTAV